MSDREGLETAPRRRRWLQRRDLRFLIVVGALWVSFEGYGYVTGPSRISEPLTAALADGRSRLNIVITTRFAPEEFHLGVYQDLGVMRGSQGRSTTLFRVKAADVRALARNYWIERIDLAPPS